jgi:hypothetical protein
VPDVKCFERNKFGDVDTTGSEDNAHKTARALKLMLAVAILATGMVSSASASTHGESTCYDTIRPHGHPHIFAIYRAQTSTARRGFDAAQSANAADITGSRPGIIHCSNLG